MGDRFFARRHGARARPDDLEVRLCRVWEQRLNAAHVGPHDDFFELGGTSLHAAGVFADIHREFGADLPMSVLVEAPTVALLAQSIRGAPPQWRCLIPIRPEGRRPPLFVVHGLFGNVLMVQKLAGALGEDQPVFALQAEILDGRPVREAMTVEAIAGRYVSEIRSVQPTGPYFLFGFSFGGLVAYEMARHLRAEGEAVGYLGLGDTSVPTTDRERQSRGTLLLRLRLHLATLRRLRGHHRLGYLAERLRFRIVSTAGYLRAEAAARTRGRVPIPVRRWYVAQRLLRASRAYVPRPYAGHVYLYRTNGGDPRPDRGWGTLAHRISIETVSGAHATIMLDDVASLAAPIRRHLSVAMAEAFPHD